MRRFWNMTSRRFGIGLAVLILSLCGLGAAASADNQVPFSFTATGVVTDMTQLPGGLTQMDNSYASTATHLGDFMATGTAFIDNQENYTYTTCLVGANGTDSVCIAFSGHLERPHGECEFTDTGSYTVIGGTGAFANATGGGTFMVQYDPCTGTTGGTLTGTISQPNSQ